MRLSSIFDMLGPIMIGPSSSHTAGAVRIGRVAYKILQEIPQKVTIYFYNSFATTYEGHGSNRAVLAGLMNFKTDDPRIRDALKIAQEKKIQFQFIPAINNKFHPNTIKLILQKKEKSLQVIGISRGGGLITIIDVDGFHTHFSAQLHTLLLQAEDIKGSIAFITDVLAHDDINIATMTVDRKSKHGQAKLVLEMDNAPRQITLAYLKELPWVQQLSYIPDIDL